MWGLVGSSARLGLLALELCHCQHVKAKHSKAGLNLRVRTVDNVTQNAAVRPNVLVNACTECRSHLDKATLSPFS